MPKPRLDRTDLARFAAATHGWEEVVCCHALTGDMDYLHEVRARDLEHFSRFLLDRLLAGGQVAESQENHGGGRKSSTQHRVIIGLSSGEVTNIKLKALRPRLRTRPTKERQ